MAITGINYECLYPDVGTNDRVNDGGVWSENKISALIKDKKLGISPSKLLPDSERLRKFRLCSRVMMHSLLRFTFLSCIPHKALRQKSESSATGLIEEEKYQEICSSITLLLC